MFGLLAYRPRIAGGPAPALLALRVSIGAVAVLQCQAQTTGRLTFEVASVKPNKSSDFRSARFDFLPGRKLIIRNVPLSLIVATAYDLPFQSERLNGGPDWERAKTERYDIEGVAEEQTLPPNVPAKVRDAAIKRMLQSLLEDRFKLTLRRDPKEQPVYALVVAKEGPKLQKAKLTETDCAGLPGGILSKCHSLSGGVGRGLHGEAVDIGDVALFVQNWTDRPVVDRTGLTGLYNIQTEGWAPMRPRIASLDGQPPQGEDAHLSDPDRQTLADVFAGLGLKMESQRAVVDMFVVEHVERPSSPCLNARFSRGGDFDNRSSG